VKKTTNVGRVVPVDCALSMPGNSVVKSPMRSADRREHRMVERERHA
jgi:hypothetical protein